MQPCKQPSALSSLGPQMFQRLGRQQQRVALRASLLRLQRRQLLPSPHLPLQGRPLPPLQRTASRARRAGRCQRGPRRLQQHQGQPLEPAQCECLLQGEGCRASAAGWPGMPLLLQEPQQLLQPPA